VRLLVAMIAASALMAQAPVSEVKLPLGNGEVRYFHGAAIAGAPMLVVLPGSMEDPAARGLFTQWQALAAARQWNCVTPVVAGISDAAAKALELIVRDARRKLGADETRVYLAGPGASAGEVFYAASRTPDLWAAGLAIAGSPVAAINSFRLFGANSKLVPVMWIAPAGEHEPHKSRLRAAGFNVDVRAAAQTDEVFEWLAAKRQYRRPAEIDCETGNPNFARCYWIEMTKFDPRKRNDVLDSTRALPGSGASLGIGPFGYDPSAEGPGALVGWLPPDYSGPLKLEDRIVSVLGKEIGSGREYARFMDEIVEEKPAALIVLRGKERVRMETKINLPKREETITARVQGQYLAGEKELVIISRTVSEMRVRIPREWAPVKVSWNGSGAFTAEAAGCWILNMEKGPVTSLPCP
jgi:hypothetical protein